MWGAVVVSAVLLAVFTGETNAQDCPDGYTKRDDDCFKAFDQALSYDAANAVCAGDGGSLAMPKDSSLDTYLYNMAMSVNSGWWWIGLNDNDQEGVFKWEDGTNVAAGYSNWHNGEPNNAGGNEHCVHYGLSGIWWNDVPCSGQYRFICQVPAECEHKTTAAQYLYNWDLPPVTGSRFDFEVQANNDVHVALSAQNQDMAPMYEIVIGGWSNQQSVIRREKQGTPLAEVATPDINSPTQYRGFWITWAADGTIAVGRANEANPFMQWVDPNPLAITYAGYTTGWTSTGRWKFCPADVVTCSIDVVFAVDRSSSIPSSSFATAKQYIIDFNQCFTGENVMVGLTAYDCVPRTIVRLGMYTAGDAGLDTAINGLQHTGGLSGTGRAIRHMKYTSNFRDGINGAAVILTDGMAQGYGQSVDNYGAAASMAMNAGITMYGVAYGNPNFVNIAALETMCGGSDKVFDINSDPCELANRIVEDLYPC